MAKRHLNQIVVSKRLIRASALALTLAAGLMLPALAEAQDRGAGALFSAIRANDLDAVKQIVASGADPRARNEQGLSAPQAAVRMGHHTIAQFLLSYRRPRTEPPAEQAIDQALDQAVAETQETTGPVAASSQTGDDKSPVTLPEPAGTAISEPPAQKPETPGIIPSPAEVADLRDSPEIPPHNETTPVLTPIPHASAVDEGTPLSHDPGKVADARPGENSALPPPPAETNEPEASPDTASAPNTSDKPGVLARAKGWLGNLLGFGENKPGTSDTPLSSGALTPPAKTAETSAKSTAETADKRRTGTLPPEEIPGAPADLDRLAALDDPTLDPQKSDLPAADLPAAVANEPIPDDPLGQALAQRAEVGEPSADGAQDPLLSLFGDTPSEAAQQVPKSTPEATPNKVDLMAMPPKERLAWLDSLLAKPIARNAENALAESKEEAFSHLRQHADRQAAEAQPARKSLSAEEQQKLATDTSAVEDPTKGGPKSRRLKIPLPPPDPKGRKNYARDPWFRDVSPDEPDIRAAHKSLKAPPPERGAPAPAIPKVPQLTNQPQNADGSEKVATNVPSPPPIRETTPPPTANPVPPPPRDTLDALEKEFGSPSPTPGPANDPLAAELGLDTPDKSAPANDPLAAELGLDAPSTPQQATSPASPAAPANDPLAAELGLDENSTPAADPLAAELGIGTTEDASQQAAASDDPLSQALGDLSSLIENDSPTNVAEDTPPTATPTEILSALPAGSEVRLDAEGRPALPAAWTLPVVLPGQAPPLQDLASAYVTPASFRAGFDKSNAAGGRLPQLPDGAISSNAWPVTRIQMADGAIVQPPAPPLPDGSQTEQTQQTEIRTLDGMTLSLGSGASLYNTFVPENAAGGEGRAPECVAKAGGRTQFCIKELQWPAFLEPRFLVSTILYTGTASVVRFDDGVPTRMHTVFGADGFNDIADWLVRRFGPPTSTVARSIAPFGQSRRENPTMVWRAIDRVTQKTVSLEIRNYDDTRDGFPDIRNGVMMLYREGAPGIFPQVSVHELMRLKRTG